MLDVELTQDLLPICSLRSRIDMNWQEIPQWYLHKDGSSIFVKVNTTVEDTIAENVLHDGNIHLDLHKTESGRDVGYALQCTALPEKRLPRVVLAKSCAYVLYRPEDYQTRQRGSIIVLYMDINVRVLKYKIGRYVDFMFVVRATSDASE